MKRILKRILRKLAYNFIKFIVPCIVVLSVIFCTSISAFAVTDNIYTICTSKPTITESSGYIEVLTKNSNNQYFAYVFGWNVFTENADTKTHVDITFQNNRLYFNVFEYGSTSVSGAIALYHLSSTRALYYYEGISDTEHYFTITDTIVNFNVYGNYGDIDITLLDNTYQFALEYTNQSPILVRLDKIYEILAGGKTSSPPINSDSLNNYQQNEELIQQGTNQGIADGKVLFNDIDTIANNSTILSGLSVMSALVNNFLNVDTNIYTLVRVALSLGFFAFVVGMSVTIISAVRRGKK